MSTQINEMAQEAARQIAEDFDRIHRDAQAHSHPSNYTGYLVARLWPVIAAVAEKIPPLSHWGVFCSQCNVWLVHQNGDPFFYPAPEIAEAVMDSERNWHLWQVTKFGEQQPVDPASLSAGSPICPAYHERQQS